jgi:hypothetical protein
MLEVQHDRVWHDIVILDEFWFSLSTDHKSIWLPQDERVSERERHAIQSQKFMLTLVWNLGWFHLIHVIAKGRKFNASCSVIEILSVISQWRSSEAKEDDGKVIIHADNARPCTVQLSSQFFEQIRRKSTLSSVFT